MQKNKKILSDYLVDLQKVDSIEKLDRLITKITNSTDSIYNNFRCKSGCFTCCKGANIPPVYAKEWQRMREQIKKLPEETRNQIKENLKYLLKKYELLLNSANDSLLENSSQSQLADITKHLKNEYSEEACPLHINGVCSVYEVRSSKCRGFGYFSVKSDNEVKLLTCEALACDIHKFFSLNKTKQIIFPYWNAFENKLSDLSKDVHEKYEKAIIPFWLKSDFESGEL